MEPVPVDRPAPARAAPSRGRLVRTLLLVAVVVYVLVRLSLLRLANYPYPLDLAAAWTGTATTAGKTIPALVIVWSILAVAIVVVSGWLRRRCDDLVASEAALGAVVVLWAMTDVVLLVLGPTGWYRPNVLRRRARAGGPDGVSVAARRTDAGTAAAATVAAGAWVAAFTVALAIVPLVLMQIGSPVSPFMDILALIAAVQKVVTFHLYDPFANDASGIIALGRGSVGYDAPLSFVSLVAGLPAHLGISALIVPAGLLQITALYLLGRRSYGSMAGGLATLFLMQTFAWRRTMDIRGTCLTFALVSAGLAIMAGRRNGTRTALAGLTLGTAVTVNPLIGAVGMLVASVQAVVAWLDCGVPIVVSVAALAGATVFAMPQVMIGLSRPAPVWLLPIVAILGLLVLAGAARLADRPWRPWRQRPYARMVAILGVAFTVLLVHARHRFEFMDDQWYGYETLALLSTLGFAAAAAIVWRRPDRRPGASIPALTIGGRYGGLRARQPVSLRALHARPALARLGDHDQDGVLLVALLVGAARRRRIRLARARPRARARRAAGRDARHLPAPPRPGAARLRRLRSSRSPRPGAFIWPTRRGATTRVCRIGTGSSTSAGAPSAPCSSTRWPRAGSPTTPTSSSSPPASTTSRARSTPGSRWTRSRRSGARTTSGSSGRASVR